MTRKISLPLSSLGAPSARPTVDAMRKRLGGRVGPAAAPRAGEIVALPSDAPAEKLGVVLCASGDELYVWVADGIVRRIRRDQTSEPATPAPRDLVAVAGDARVFGGLREAQRVRFQNDDAVVGEGELVEKCRFGALVLRPDGVLVGVGFRRIWPAAVGPALVPPN